MDDAEQTVMLIRRNRDLLALATEARRTSIDAQERAAETCLMAQRARMERARRREVRDQRQSACDWLRPL
jgi:hypothetical protein